MPTDAMNRVDVLRAARAEAGLLLVGLDFDGTLAPIVPVPDDAVMPDTTRAVLHALTLRADTCVAIVSGRALADLRARVPLERIYFAGNHGLEIVGPDVHRVHPAAEASRPRLQDIAEALRRELPPLPGVIVEDKGLTLSVHYRMVDDEADAEAVRRQVREHAGRHSDVVLTEGKKVVEIRPAVEWHKGLAFAFLRDAIEQVRERRGPAVFIGDDRTDEDVFRVLGGTDCSVIVGDPPPHPTVARAMLPTPEAVAVFLQRLLD